MIFPTEKLHFHFKVMISNQILVGGVPAYLTACPYGSLSKDLCGIKIGLARLGKDEKFKLSVLEQTGDGRDLPIMVVGEK